MQLVVLQTRRYAQRRDNPLEQLLRDCGADAHTAMGSIAMAGKLHFLHFQTAQIEQALHLIKDTQIVTTQLVATGGDIYRS